jgi:hypothetical protein
MPGRIRSQVALLAGKSEAAKTNQHLDCHLAFAAFPFPAPIDRSQLINWHRNCLDNLHSVTRPQRAIETLRYKVFESERGNFNSGDFIYEKRR